MKITYLHFCNWQHVCSYVCLGQPGGYLPSTTLTNSISKYVADMWRMPMNNWKKTVPPISSCETPKRLEANKGLQSTFNSGSYSLTVSLNYDIWWRFRAIVSIPFPIQAQCVHYCYRRFHSFRRKSFGNVSDMLQNRVPYSWRMPQSTHCKMHTLTP